MTEAHVKLVIKPEEKEVKSQRRYLLNERLHNATAYYSKGWQPDELKEKASSLALRLLGLDKVLREHHGINLLTVQLREELKELGASYLPKTYIGRKPRQKRS